MPREVPRAWARKMKKEEEGFLDANEWEPEKMLVYSLWITNSGPAKSGRVATLTKVYYDVEFEDIDGESYEYLYSPRGRVKVSVTKNKDDEKIIVRGRTVFTLHFENNNDLNHLRNGLVVRRDRENSTNYYSTDIDKLVEIAKKSGKNFREDRIELLKEINVRL